MAGLPHRTAGSISSFRRRRKLAVRRYVGLWRAEVLESEVVGRRPVSFAADPAERRRRRGPVQPTLELLVGDSSGARAQISVPYDRR